MRKFWSLIFAITFLTGLCNAQSNEVSWIDYEGKLGEMDILLSYAELKNGSLTGNYCYKKHDNRISLNGKISGLKIELTEYLDGVPNGYFTGQMFTNEQTRIEGTWTNSSKSKTLNFSINLTSMCSGTSDFRYSNALKGTNESVENFMKHVKSSILNGERNWIGNDIHYPIRTSINNKEVVIKNSIELTDNFDLIFHQEFLNKIKSSYTSNLFVKPYYGVMLGNGSIWINDKPTSKENIFDYEITAINNSYERKKEIVVSNNQNIIAGKIYYGMNTIEAKTILDREFVPIKIGDHTLNSAILISIDSRIVGLSYKSALASMIIKNSESKGSPFGDLCPRCKLIFEDCQNIEEWLLNKGYEIMYKHGNSEILDPFKNTILLILRDENKIVGFKTIFSDDWEVIITNKEILNNPAAFKSFFNISLSQAKSDMQDVF